ncbi:hypothetical protein ECC02_012630 [Trypanosoma cruzi]|uniref:Uncharacterized protein n=1 Tax=Trypanosoma cruzi TaxID=5693 RepID=A0A7J6XJP5_TRYCR|nr:hypothetical protein ECC02_012630 [Trypanosoma cruzi]
MKRLCGSLSRTAGKPPRRSTTDSAKTTRRKEFQELATSRMAGIVQPCCNHSHRETRKSVWMCAESTATVIVGGGHRGTVRHAPAHNEQRPQPEVQKQRREWSQEQATSSHTAGIVRPCCHVSTGRKPTPRCRQEHSCRPLCKYLCVCAGETEKKRSTGRHIRTARGTAGWQRYMRYGPNLNNHTRWQHTPIHKKQNKRKTKNLKNTARPWLCVWRCGCLPALAARKQNKRERNVCSAPQALVARSHVTAPSARRSSRPLLMRAAGEAHRAVVMSVSVGVRVEQLGGKHTAPLTGRVQKKQLKEGRVEKKKPSIVIAPKSKKGGMCGVKDLKCTN